jgi:hypothetical protein
MQPPIQPPTVFLRNKFSIKPGLNGRYFEGQEDLLRHATPKLQLLFACGSQPLIRARPAPEPLPAMIHIWHLPRWDSLYNAMYSFSETDWYSSEVRSLRIEHQDLLVGIGYGIELTPRPRRWERPDVPGYVYVYEEVRLRPSVTKIRHLRHVNWLASQLRERGVTLAWIGAEITGTPSQLCFLWRAPDIAVFEAGLRDMAYERPFATRFAELMLGLEEFSRQYMYPESTEEIDNVLDGHA